MFKGVRFRRRAPQQFAFDLDVPEELTCPCSETERTHVGWFVRGVVERKRRGHLVLEGELNVYDGPGVQARAWG